MSRVKAHEVYMVLGSIASIPLGISSALILAELYTGRNAYAILYFIPVLIVFWLVFLWVIFFILKKTGVSFAKANNILGLVFLASVFHVGIPAKTPGINVQMSTGNIGNDDLMDLSVIADNGALLTKRNSVEASFGRDRGFATSGEALAFVPGSVMVSWNNSQYKDKEVILLPRREVQVEVRRHIPSEVIRKASGWGRGRLVISLYIADNDVYRVWALWPNIHDKQAGSLDPLAYGGDKLPPEPIEKTLCSNLYKDYRQGVNQARMLLDKVLAHHIDLDACMRSRPLLVHVLSESGYGWYARMLLEKGANPNRLASTKVSPLMLAAGEGDTDLVRDLLSRHADIDQRNMHGDTALIYAAHAGHEKIVKLLLESGADRSINDYSALSGAQSQGFHDVVKLLQKNDLH